MKIYVPLWYLHEFFLERETFQTKLSKKIKTHILRPMNVFRKLYR